MAGPPCTPAAALEEGTAVSPSGGRSAAVSPMTSRLQAAPVRPSEATASVSSVRPSLPPADPSSALYLAEEALRGRAMATVCAGLVAAKYYWPTFSDNFSAWAGVAGLRLCMLAIVLRFPTVRSRLPFLVVGALSELVLLLALAMSYPPTVLLSALGVAVAGLGCLELVARSPLDMAGKETSVLLDAGALGVLLLEGGFYVGAPHLAPSWVVPCAMLYLAPACVNLRQLLWPKAKQPARIASPDTKFVALLVFLSTAPFYALLTRCLALAFAS